jgi:hypothetical protein
VADFRHEQMKLEFFDVGADRRQIVTSRVSLHQQIEANGSVVT